MLFDFCWLLCSLVRESARVRTVELQTGVAEGIPLRSFLLSLSLFSKKIQKSIKNFIYQYYGDAR